LGSDKIQRVRKRELFIATAYFIFHRLLILCLRKRFGRDTLHPSDAPLPNKNRLGRG
jgi:hypothetical protein